MSNESPKIAPAGAPLSDVTAFDATVEAEIRRLTRRSFATGALAAVFGGGAATWVATRALEDGIPWPLRRVLRFNEGVARSVFDPQRLAPEFAPQLATEPRVNGRVGLMSATAVDNWTVHITGAVDRHIPLSAIRELPMHEMTTEFKCVEGWSRIVNWKGVRLADFLQKFGAPSQYIGMATPVDGQDDQGNEDRYYVGFDRPSALHPQTLLAVEMNGQPLTDGHGAPLRLVSTVKYGYKCIKRLSVIDLTDIRPADYWAKRGYDWYGGH